jgi:hypothetical protein
MFADGSPTVRRHVEFCRRRRPNDLFGKTLKAQIYPSDDITSADVERLIVELSSNGLILIYSADGKEFISGHGWHHQKIDKPKPSKFPDPFVEPSPTPRRKVATDLRGSEGKGSDGIDDAAAAAPTRVYAFEDGIIRLNQRDFDSWQQAYSHLDFRAELLSLSKWAQDQGANWFHAVKGALAKRNRDVKAEKERQAKQGDFKWQSGIEGVV